MPNPQSKFMYWSYGPEYQGTQDLPDPRIQLARQTGWKKFHSHETEYPTPEPDNYNRAVLAHIPIDCSILEDQVFYKHRDSWITLMYVPEEQIVQVDSWIRQCRPMAVWCHLKPPKVKPQRGMLWTRDNISDTNMTDNERLYTMGYFEELKVKYFSDDTEYVDSLLGSARAILENFVPEEQNDEVDDLY